MTSKTRDATPRFCKSSTSISTTARPLPSSITDYTSNVERSTDRMMLDKLSESDGLSDEENGDWLEEKSCIKCSRGGKLLLCSACPIAVHDQCIPFNPRYDEDGNFLCPFCWYKLKLSIVEDVRKEALLSKKVLREFLDFKPSEVSGDKKEKQNDGREEGNDLNVKSVMEGRNCDEHLNGMDQEKDNQQVDDLQDEGILECKEQKCNENLNRTEEGEDNQRVDDEQAERISEDKEQGESLDVHCIEEDAAVDGMLYELAGIKSDAIKAAAGKQMVEEETDLINKDACKTNGSSMGGDAALDVPDLTDSDNETLIVRMRYSRKRSNQSADSSKKTSLHSYTTSADEARTQKEKVSPLKKDPTKTSLHPSTTSAEEARNQNKEFSPLKKYPKKSSLHPDTTSMEESRHKNKEVSPLKKSRQSQAPSNKIPNMSFAHEKRKRLHWMSDEEEMLREGVQKFSTTVNKNLPWRKILEFGRHIFDETRTPADLKDKWRNIMAKESSTTEK